MTQERFFQIVDDPELLRRITYEELKTLALAYPYAHNLRCLLALKARQIDHPDATRNLATAAAYSLDRTKLFLLAAPQVIVPHQVLAPEEVLELKPIETVKRELEALAPLAREEESVAHLANSADYQYSNLGVPHLSEHAREERSFEPQPIAAEASAKREPSSTPAPEAIVTAEIIQQEPISTQAEIHAPPVRQPFSEWISHFQPPVLEPVQRPRPLATPTTPTEEKTEAPSKPSGIAQQLAERSVAENQDVISETLAKLYAKQGYRDKSAQMYARLALLFPEKSAYFAAEIDKLKK
ncbi:MAG: hypothetical protein IPH31_05270 [Lewinellaceae bacterium]|nr:hypothetical protein [Lewinellaceae bacterium]